MGRTKKTGTVGRFGTRYGLKIKKIVREMEAQQRKKHKCPACSHSAVKRQAAGIWVCNKCGNKFAGGAYLP